MGCLAIFSIICFTNIQCKISERCFYFVKIYILQKTLKCFSTCLADCLLLRLLEVEAFDSYWLVTISGSIDNGPTATLAKDVIFLLRILQLGLLQKEPNTHTCTIVNHQVPNLTICLYTVSPR